MLHPQRTTAAGLFFAAGLITPLTFVGSACTGDDVSSATADAVADLADDSDLATNPETAPDATPFEVSEADFTCILDWPKVRRFHITSLSGRLDEALAVANDPGSAPFPAGTLIQLVPFEAMVKRHQGWNAETDDWEYFALTVNRDSVAISSRGAADTVNQFGGNCFACHSKAADRFDSICETTNGCDPLGLNAALITLAQDGDPRCQ